VFNATVMVASQAYTLFGYHRPYSDSLRHQVVGIRKYDHYDQK